MISSEPISAPTSPTLIHEKVKRVSGLSLLFSSEPASEKNQSTLSTSSNKLSQPPTPSFSGLQRSNSTQINYFEDDDYDNNEFLEQQKLRNQRSSNNVSSSYFKNSFYGSYSGDEDDDYEDMFGVEFLPASSSLNIPDSFPESLVDKSLPKPVLEHINVTSTAKTSPKPVDSPTKSIPKVTFSSEDLLATIINFVSQRYQEESKSLTNEELNVLSQKNVVQHLQLLPAEEDGTPMDDLPDFSNCTDILNLGVTDFAVIDRSSSTELLHIRISGTIQGNKPFQGSTKPLFSPAIVDASGQYDIDSEQDDDDEEDEDEDENGDHFYTLNSENGRLSDELNADMIQCFRTDTDLQKDLEKDLLKQNLQLTAPQVTPHSMVLPLPEDTSNLFSKVPQPLRSPIQTGRGRSSSGNLLITYRRRGSNRWKVAKELGLSPNGSLLPETSNVMTNSLSSKKSVPINNSLAIPSKPSHHDDLFVNSASIERRHSDRPFDDPEEQLIRKMSNTSTGTYHERTLSTQSLNPHTSSSFAMPFSPKEVRSQDHFEEDDAEYINSHRKMSSHMLINNSQKALLIQTLLDANLNIQIASENGNGLSTNSQHGSTPTSANASRRNTNVSNNSFRSRLSSCASSSDSSDSSDEEAPIEGSLVAGSRSRSSSAGLRKSRSIGSQSSTHSASSKIQPTPYERSGVTSLPTSQNSSRRSSVSGWFQTFWNASPRRRSSVSSISSITSNTTVGTTSIPSENVSRRSSILSMHHPAIPVIQNLDTGDVFPVGALRYEPFKLPETMSPSVLFEESYKQSEKISRSRRNS